MTEMTAFRRCMTAKRNRRLISRQLKRDFEESTGQAVSRSLVCLRLAETEMHVRCPRKKHVRRPNIVVFGQWFRDNDVTVLDCLSCPPDAKPIKNFWQILKVAATAGHPRKEWAAVQATLRDFSRGSARDSRVFRNESNQSGKQEEKTRSIRAKILHQRNVS